MASLRSLRAVPALAGRRSSVAFLSTVRHLPVNLRSDFTRPPRTSLVKFTVVFLLGAGMGAGKCVAWWKYASNFALFAPDFKPDINPEVFHNFLSSDPTARESLREIGSSFKLKTVFDDNNKTISRRGLLKAQPEVPDLRTVLFRIEDVGMEPGKPNVVGFLAVVEPHPEPNMEGLFRSFDDFMLSRDDRGELARRGWCLFAVMCGDELCIGVKEYQREGPVIVEDGRHSASSDNDVIERVDG